MIQEISKLINPVRVLKAEDFKMMGQVILQEKINKAYRGEGEHMLNQEYDKYEIGYEAIELLSRYETLINQPLKKELILEWLDGEYEFNKGYREEVAINGVGLFTCGEDTFSDIIYQANKRKSKNLSYSDSFITKLIQ